MFKNVNPHKIPVQNSKRPKSLVKCHGCHSLCKFSIRDRHFIDNIGKAISKPIMKKGHHVNLKLNLINIIGIRNNYLRYKNLLNIFITFLLKI